MKQATTLLTFGTPRRGLIEITGEIAKWLDSQPCKTGLLTVFCRHTSASLLIQENAAPEVRTDLERFFETLAPEFPLATPTMTKGRTICPRICVRRSPRCSSRYR